jgi:hypothetical protein
MSDPQDKPHILALEEPIRNLVCGCGALFRLAEGLTEDTALRKALYFIAGKMGDDARTLDKWFEDATSRKD